MMKIDLLLLVSRRCRVLYLVVMCFFFFFKSICLTLIGVNLLLKNKNFSQPNLVQLRSHLVKSEICQCHRSFHLFCTDLFPKTDHDIDMIHIHPAPRIYERDSPRRISTPYKNSHSHHRHQEDNEQDPIGTPRSEPVQMTISESQLLEKKVLFICVIYK